ncbi:interactor protein for cytohesin exchange factors 1-like [Chanos chanos]|uniref:Interactor protein for cytohesin exchange factors 1-like n=1 Tax=Chanos chanos TaxID=29144 RepID=A0A6J2WCQ9_CHACN|nr:interactor protein for cytohesin exchange factors 1-like [Chanos chanos]
MSKAQNELLRDNVTMSKRRVSIKELDPVDHQGWLYRKKKGKGFLGIKWKKCWFVLKKTSLYWYTNKMDEKAEGLLNLTDFVIDRATECKKKYAFKACHSQTMRFYFAAENKEERDIWLNKLGLASIQYDPTENHKAEYYSETSDPDEFAESFSTQYSEQLSQDPFNTDNPSDDRSGEPSTTEEPLVCSAQIQALSLTEKVNSECREDSSTVSHHSSAMEDSVMESTICNGGSEENEEVTNDEMERLYIHLKQASLSPTGERKPSTKREFRTSFIKRCKNQTINEKLHHLRALGSTLKAKEADLQILDQVLADSNLTASKFREWKETNSALLQQISQGHSQEEPSL